MRACRAPLQTRGRPGWLGLPRTCGARLGGLQVGGEAVQPLLAGAHRALQLRQAPARGKLSEFDAAAGAALPSARVQATGARTQARCAHLGDEALELALLPRELVARGLQPPALLHRLIALLHQLPPCPAVSKVLNSPVHRAVRHDARVRASVEAWTALQPHSAAGAACCSGALSHGALAAPEASRLTTRSCQQRKRRRRLRLARAAHLAYIHRTHLLCWLRAQLWRACKVLLVVVVVEATHFVHLPVHWRENDCDSRRRRPAVSVSRGSSFLSSPACPL